MTRQEIFGIFDAICAFVFANILWYLLSVNDTTVTINKYVFVGFILIHFVNFSLSSYLKLTDGNALN